jgi:hypothetical protein
MSFRSSASHLRFGKLGVFSIGVIAFALATLQGCAPSTVTASSAREPGGATLPSLGAMRADDPPRAERHVAERPVGERASSRAREPRTFRPEFCRRCSN